MTNTSIPFAVIHPAQLLDLRDDPNFVSAERYGAAFPELERDEVGALVRFAPDGRVEHVLVRFIVLARPVTYP